MATQIAREFSEEQLAGRDPHSPEDAAELVLEDLASEQATTGAVAEEAEDAAREVEAQERDEE
jgi:hypothetical protein